MCISQFDSSQMHDLATKDLSIRLGNSTTGLLNATMVSKLDIFSTFWLTFPLRRVIRKFLVLLSCPLMSIIDPG